MLLNLTLLLQLELMITVGTEETGFSSLECTQFCEQTIDKKWGQSNPSIKKEPLNKQQQKEHLSDSLSLSLACDHQHLIVNAGELPYENLMCYWWKLGMHISDFNKLLKGGLNPSQFPWLFSGGLRWRDDSVSHLWSAGPLHTGCNTGKACPNHVLQTWAAVQAPGVRKQFTMCRWTLLHGWPALTKGKKTHINVWVKEVKMISFIELSPIYVRGVEPHRIACFSPGHTGLSA